MRKRKDGGRVRGFQHGVNVPTQVEPMLRTIGRIADDLEMPAYAVGGCVRDWCLGIDRTKDLDLTVEGEGIRFAHAVARQYGAELVTHEQFGTATVVMTPRPSRSRRPARTTTAALRLDIATCRKEVYRQAAAYPKVSKGTLRDDLFRRDFTINAMALAITPSRFGELVDPFGGLRDLKARRLRILHAKSFLDDPSRVLRAVRFSHRFGFVLEPGTERVLRDAITRGALAQLNRGRWRKELQRLTEEPDPLGCLLRLEQWLGESPS